MEKPDVDTGSGSDNGLKPRQTTPKSPLSILIEAPEKINPILAFYNEVKDQDLAQLSAADQMILTVRIEQVVKDGDAERERARFALGRLKRSQPQPSKDVPLGF